MKDLKQFDVSFRGLSYGLHSFEYSLGEPFFGYFGYEDFTSVDLVSRLILKKTESHLELNLNTSGCVGLVCDVSGEGFLHNVDDSFGLVVRFGGESQDTLDSLVVLPYNEHKLNIAHYIYESVVLSIPMKRLHPGLSDGTLVSDTLAHLEALKPKSIQFEGADPRWNKLKTILN